MLRYLGRLAPAAALVIALAGNLCAADTAQTTTSKETVEKKDVEVKVSVSANDSKVKDVLESLAQQSKEKLVVESTVKGTIPSLSLTGVTLESALSAVCKSAKCEWRKVYISPTSKLLEQPDRFAATVRLMSGLSFPDMVLAGSSMKKIAVHCTEKKAVEAAESMSKDDLGMTRVYLITNDLAIAQSKAEESAEESTDKAVDKYASLSRDLMDVFMKMSPEERERAMVEALSMMEQVDPGYMSAAMQAVMNTDPDVLKRMVSRQTEMMFSMPDDQRRAMMKLNMEAMKTLTPEQMKMLHEDAMAVAEEMKAEADR